MKALLRFAGWVDSLSEWLGRLSGVLVTLLVLLGFFNVLLRYVGRSVQRQLTSNAVIELQWYLFSIVFFLGFAYILRHNLNVRVDLFYTNWPPRRKAIVNLLGALLFLIPLCIVGIIVTYNPVMFSWGRLPNGRWGTWEISPDPNGLPRAPIKTMIIVAFVLLFLQGIAEAIKNAAILRGAAQSTIIEESEKPAGGIE